MVSGEVIPGKHEAKLAHKPPALSIIIPVKFPKLPGNLIIVYIDHNKKVVEFVLWMRSVSQVVHHDPALERFLLDSKP
jgi:hypothetical protein